MADWIFCNKCMIQFNTSIKYYLTECGHLLCHRCVEGMKLTKKCVVCNKSSDTLELNNNIDHSIACFFQPLEELYKKELDIYNFQAKQKGLRLQILTNKYTYARNQCIKANETIKKLMKEIKMLRSLLQNASRNFQYATNSEMVPGNIANDTRSDMSTTLQSKFSFNVPGSGGEYPGYARRITPGQNIFTPSQAASPIEITPRYRPNNRSETQVHRSQGGSFPFSLDGLRRSGH